MDSNARCFVLTFLIINCILSGIETLTQFLHYFLTEFATTKIKEQALAFILMRPILHLFLIIIYLCCHHEKQLTILRKIWVFFLHMACMYIGYTPGVHMSFLSKYYLDSENGMVIAKITNAYIFLLVSLPKLLIVSVNGSAIGTFTPIDIISIVFSVLFMVWCIVFYINCNIRELDFETEMDDLARIQIVEMDEHKA